jgi:cyclase
MRAESLAEQLAGDSAFCVLEEANMTALLMAAALSFNTLGNGIYEIQHPDAPDGFPQGNTTVIVGSRAVLVVDSCLLPSSTKKDIEQIRKWTSKPVTWLVNTHWHFDHTLGNATYAAAFPNLQVLTSSETQRWIENWNPGAIARYPARGQRLQAMLDSGKDSNGRLLTAEDRKELQQGIAGNAPVAAEMKGTAQFMPTIWFDSGVTIDLGGRIVDVRFLGRGNTSGDTVIFLPKEKLLVAGDLLDHPVPYFYGGFPADLAKTLARVRDLHPETIIPGHGEVLHGTGYIDTVLELVNAVAAEVQKQLYENRTKEEILASVPTQLDFAGFKKKFGNSDEFDGSFSGLVATTYAQLSLK